MNKLSTINETIEHFSWTNIAKGYIWYPTQLAKLTEYAGRKCYNSNDKIGENTDIAFNKRTMKSVHLSVLAHGYIGVSLEFDPNVPNFDDMVTFFKDEIYTNAKLINFYHDRNTRIIDIHMNIRSIIDLLNNVKKDLYSDGIKKVYPLTTIVLHIIQRIPMLNSLYDLLGEEILSYSDYIKEDFESIKWLDFKTYKKYEDDENLITYLLNPDNNGDSEVNSPIVPLPIETPIKGIELNILNVSIHPHWLPFVDPNDESKLYKHTENIFGSVTFHIKIPRIISQQELRHWESNFTDELMFELSSVSQMSQRYVNSENMECYTRANIDRDKKYTLDMGKGVMIYGSVNDLLTIISKMYGALIDDGYMKEEARDILPNGTFTEVIITKEFRALPHYFAERTAPSAQMEIRAYATPLMEYMQSLNIKEGLFNPSKYNTNLNDIK